MGFLCGIDEAGRGPLAGPVTAAAVVLHNSELAEIVGDSKKLTEHQRNSLCTAIQSGALSWATGWAWPEEIDERNIHNATLLAMERAFQQLHIPPSLIDRVEVDGKFTPPLDGWSGEKQAIIKGDALVPEIGAASIIAKVYRDTLMQRYHEMYPQWGFSSHKGYPTKKHREICQTIGLSPIHRKSFALKPVRVKQINLDFE